MGVWIETYELRNTLEYGTSHPAWVCGLKLNGKNIRLMLIVTPCVGVWIETLILLLLLKDLGHTLRGCVD